MVSALMTGPKRAQTGYSRLCVSAHESQGGTWAVYLISAPAGELARGEECWLFLQMTQVQAPLRQSRLGRPVTGSRESDALFWPQRACIQDTQTHAGQPHHTQNQAGVGVGDAQGLTAGRPENSQGPQERRKPRAKGPHGPMMEQELRGSSGSIKR